MAQCPVCHAAVSDEFGFHECANCGAQLSVDMDGKVEYSGALERVTQSLAPSEESAGQDHEMLDLDSPQEQVSDQTQPIEAGAEGEPEAVPEAEPADGFEPAMGMDDTILLAEAGAPPEAEQEEPAETQAPPEAAPEVYRAPGTTSSSPDLSDIAQFGNSEDSGSRDGVLRYTLRIQGIDTADVREAFREALTDRKFMWDVDQILRSLRGGEVRIQNIAASKAYILVSRLRSLKVRVSWEQYVLHKS